MAGATTGWGVCRASAIALMITGLGLPAIGTALAQSAASVDQRLAQDRRLAAPKLTLEERLLTGREDLLLLKPRKFFTLDLGSSQRLVSNAALSDDDASRSDDLDLLVNANADLKAETEIGELVTVYATAGLFVARYIENSALDYSGVTAGVGVSGAARGWTLAADYRHNYIGERDFGDEILSQNQLALSVYRPFRVSDATTLVVNVAAIHTWSDPDDYTNGEVRPGMRVLHNLTPNLRLGGQADVFVRAYENYFESQFGRSRRDAGASLGAALTWRPNDIVTVSGSIGFTYNNSSVSDADYSEFTFAPAIRARLRF